MLNKFKDRILKTLTLRHEKVEEGFFGRIFNRIFIINKSEKQKIMSLLNKASVQDLLFYTDVRNLPSLLKNGIKTINDLKVDSDEIYYVWSYLQHDTSIDLEFDNSSRAYFWKWTNDIEFNPKTMAVIGIDPNHLNEITQKDWLLDRAQNFVNVSENIYPETFSWVLIQDILFYKEAGILIEEYGLEIDIYFGDHGIVKTAFKNETIKPNLNQDEIKKVNLKNIKSKTEIIKENKIKEETSLDEGEK